MCLGREDVTGIVETAMKPILSVLGEVQSKLEGVVKLALQQKEIEGQIVGLQAHGKTREKFEDEIFDRVRAIEGMTEPRSSCAAIFNNLDKGQIAALKAFETLDNQIKSRTWAIVIVLLGAFLSVMGSVTVGLLIYFFRSGGVGT